MDSIKFIQSVECMGQALSLNSSLGEWDPGPFILQFRKRMRHKLICLTTRQASETRANSLESSSGVWDKGPFTRWSVEGVCQGYE